MTIIIPTHTPALNISPIAWHPDKNVTSKIRNIKEDIDFLIKFFISLSEEYYLMSCSFKLKMR